MTRPALILGTWLWLVFSWQIVSAQTGVVRANGVLPGASVSATLGDKTLTTLTDDRGEYRLDGITDGAWVLEVQMFRFAPLRKEVEVKGAFTLNLDLAFGSVECAGGCSGKTRRCQVR